MSDASETDAQQPRGERGSPRRWTAPSALGAWLLSAVPLVGVVELALHAKQTSSVVPAEDWAAARELVEAELRPDDLVLFAPFWADPIGRQSFKGIATMKREGRSDERRFARAIEVSIRAAHAEALSGWRRVKEQKAGAVTVALLENPAYTPVIDDLVDLVSPDRLSVARVDDEDHEQACTFQRGASAGGSTAVPQGLLTPADKFVCPGGGHAGVAVLHALDHHPHVCIYATPQKGATLRLRFSNVAFGSSLFGHSGLQWVVERTPAPEKLSVSFSALGHRIGTHFHKVGAGWTGFELPTPELDGKKGELVVEIAPSGQRQFCFEATTRHAEASR